MNPAHSFTIVFNTKYVVVVFVDDEVTGVNVKSFCSLSTWIIVKNARMAFMLVWCVDLVRNLVPFIDKNEMHFNHGTLFYIGSGEGRRGTRQTRVSISGKLSFVQIPSPQPPQHRTRNEKHFTQSILVSELYIVHKRKTAKEREWAIESGKKFSEMKLMDRNGMEAI